MSVRDLIIVGAGPSGLAAAITAKKRGLDFSPLLQRFSSGSKSKAKARKAS